MSIRLDELAQALTDADHQQGLYQHIHTIHGIGSKFRADTHFLAKFSNLRYYDGALCLTTAQDLDIVLLTLDSQRLKLDLNHQISDSALLQPLLVKIPYLELTNLDGAGGYGLILDNGTAQLFRQHGDSISALGGQAWLGVLASPQVKQIFDLHLQHQGLLSQLPANIQVLLITDIETVHQFQPDHKIILKWAPGQDSPGKKQGHLGLHPNVSGFIYPHGSEIHDMLKAHPELKASGLDAHRYFNKHFDLDWLSQYPDLELHCWVSTQEMQEYVRSLSRYHPIPIQFVQNSALKKCSQLV